MKPVKDIWTGELVGKMHVAEVTQEELAAELGWNKAYVCMILNGSRKPAGAREKLEAAFESVMAKRSTSD